MQAYKRLTATEPVQRLTLGGDTSFFIVDGSLWVCGSNSGGELGLGDDVRRDVFTRVDLSERVRQVSVGDYHTALVTGSGRLLICGNNYQGQLGLVIESGVRSSRLSTYLRESVRLVPVVTVRPF